MPIRLGRFFYPFYVREKNMKKKNKKNATTLAQQITRLRVRNFDIPSDNEELVKEFLSNIGYYRASGYYLPYYDRKLEMTPQKISYQKIMDTYWFDKEIKSILLYLMASIEVEYKARIADTLCLKYGPYFFYDASYFSDNQLHKKWIRKFEDQFNYQDSNDDLFKSWYKKEYNSKFPLWVAFQLININDLSKFYDLLKTPYKKELRNSLRGNDIDLTRSWLRSMTVVRNICAHNGRLFYRSISTSPKLPKDLKKEKLNIKRPFVIIVVMKRLCTDKKVWDRFLNDLIDIIVKYPEVEIFHYGFPNNWYDILNK